MNTLLAPIDNYCERLDAGLWAEPLNAVSNGAFLIAAFLLLRMYRHKDREVLALIIMVAMVGVGSFLFHTFANGLAMFADVIPIGVLVVIYIWVAFRRLLGWSWKGALAAMLLFLCAAPITGAVPEAYKMNGSAPYLPCLMVLVFLVGKMHGHAQRKRMTAAAIIFTLSLSLRSLDMQGCGIWPMGTHFLWHCLNGVLLYLLVSIVLRCPKSSHLQAGHDVP